MKTKETEKNKMIIKPTDPVHLFPEEIMKTGRVELQTQDGTESISDAKDLVEKVDDARSSMNQDFKRKIKKSLLLNKRIKKIEK